MEPILTVKQMRELDEWTFENCVDDKELMRRAGAALADEILPFLNIAIIAGPGNNGGDGYAAVFDLVQTDKILSKRVSVFYTKLPCGKSSKFFFDNIRHENVKVAEFSEDLDLSGFDCVADCLLGTGFNGEPRGLVADAIHSINEAGLSGTYVISMDINSGVNGDTGICALGVKSDLTLSVGYLKTGLVNENFVEYSKKVKNVNIGYELTPESLGPFASSSEILWTE